MKKGIVAIIGILVVMLALGGMAYGQGKATGRMPGQTQAAGPTKVNINLATAQEMQKIPGMTQTLAQDIINYRMANGPFGSVNDLKHVKGITDQSMESLRLHVQVKSNLNTSSAQDLSKVPGVSRTVAQNIVSYREANGPFSSMDDLKRVSGVDDYTLGLMKKFIEVEGK